MKEFHPNNIQRIVFDLQSISIHFDQEAWDNFKTLVQVFDDRDFEVVLVTESVQANEWQNTSRIVFIHSKVFDALENNDALQGDNVFWVTDDLELQSELKKNQQGFAGNIQETPQNGGLQYHHVHDLLYIFHPSHNTALDLSTEILKLKENSPQVPLILGIGGPDECGHSFFTGELFDALEDQAFLVAGLDLTQVLGTEFLDHETPGSSNTSDYWRTGEIRDWLLNEILLPYSQGERVCIEDAPDFLQEYEITNFPFFLAPEMILLTWGTTLFIDDLQKMLDVKLLLDLSPKTAAARIFALDERENFDPSFIDIYVKKEGMHYNNYLVENQVMDQIDYLVDFNNFNAFRLKSKS